MKMRKMIRVRYLALLPIVLMSLCVTAFAKETIRQSVEKEMPLLRGDLWIKMDPDSKVAFVWGVGHVVTIEEVIMKKYPDQSRDTFVTKVIEATSANPMKMTDIVAAVDKYYQENPDKLNTPVMQVIWDTMVKPYIKTGIGGKPLK